MRMTGLRLCELMSSFDLPYLLRRVAALYTCSASIPGNIWDSSPKISRDVRNDTDDSSTSNFFSTSSTKDFSLPGLLTITYFKTDTYGVNNGISVHDRVTSDQILIFKKFLVKR